MWICARIAFARFLSLSLDSKKVCMLLDVASIFLTSVALDRRHGPGALGLESLSTGSFSEAQHQWGHPTNNVTWHR